MNNWKQNILTMKNDLESLSVRDCNMKEVHNDKAFEIWVDYTCTIKDNRKSVYLVGNGASASMASHMAADLGKNGGVSTEVFTDMSLITAIANDISYDEVFAEPLKRKMVEGDMLVAISSSGNSPNVVKACSAAKALKGIVITISALRNDNKIRQMGDLNFYVPCTTYGMAESCHAAILHFWIDKMLDRIKT
ncbi:MAG: SIS domain-containing protein [Desulfobacterales bacterium]|nr:SIS domain-containing protein [Desulfobacterales bacterium]